MDQNSESQPNSISQDTQDKTEQINEKLNLGSEETKDLASKLMLNDFNWLENKDKTTDNDLSADRILNDTQVIISYLSILLTSLWLKIELWNCWSLPTKIQINNWILEFSYTCKFWKRNKSNRSIKSK